MWGKNKPIEIYLDLPNGLNIDESADVELIFVQALRFGQKGIYR